ncbi:MAG: [FeFe] hydrogenase H-cluster maturation GTPase HydF [Eubacterium sp.]|nr:[FeFe] hydrogenase H-cluster maturation GTPase HydF [Eubacterium sp.]MCI8919919.1 [FeFe] hydrogenase H-cluster maturation GTPase HydF [Eubacterium sp.]
MGTTLNDTPSADRTHIAFFGRMNSGKSSLVNALAGQEISIVSDVSGTTTDPVKKAMEIHGIGPCVLIDTAGFDDAGDLGDRRVMLARKAAQQADLAVMVISDQCGCDFTYEKLWIDLLHRRDTPVIIAVNKMREDKDAQMSVETAGIEKDMQICAEEARIDKKMQISAEAAGTEKDTQLLAEKIEALFQKQPLIVNALTGDGVSRLKAELVNAAPKAEAERFITGSLLCAQDIVMLVMPQDIQAPKGRLILPQVQTLREILDKKCTAICTTTDQMETALAALRQPPKLIITDSQAYKTVYEKKPQASRLTSFSTLFAAYKGDIHYFVKGAHVIDTLTSRDKVLIAECCTHAPLDEDIGREKLPRLLRKKAGEGLRVDIVSGMDFPQDLSEYRLIIQCGACMFNRKYVMSRVEAAKAQNIPMTNYGVAIAHINGILGNIELTG